MCGVKVDRLAIQRIIESCDGLPVRLQALEPAIIQSRVITADVIRQVGHQSPPEGGERKDDWEARMAKRRAVLERFVGRTLVCVYYRLPGSQLTLEIDPLAEAVVHWESLTEGSAR